MQAIQRARRRKTSHRLQAGSYINAGAIDWDLRWDVSIFVIANPPQEGVAIMLVRNDGSSRLITSSHAIASSPADAVSVLSP